MGKVAGKQAQQQESKKPDYSYGRSPYPRRCRTRESYRPLVTRSCSHASLWTPFHPPTHKMEAVRKANLRDFGSVLVLLARGSSQPNAATSNFPPPPRAPPSSSPRVVTLCHVLGISLLPPPRKNTDNDLENSKHFSALLPSFLRRSGDTEGFSSQYREYKKTKISQVQN